METGEIIALAAVGIGGYLLLSRPAATAPAAAAPGPLAATGAAQSSGPYQQIVGAGEGVIQQATGVPVAAIGNAAIKAPTALKVIFPAIAATAYAQKLITHPIDTVKSTASTVAKGTEKVASAVGSAVSSGYHAFTSIF